MTPRRGNNEGSISHRQDGRWEARLSLPEGGRRSIYGRTRKEVAERLKKALAALQKGEELPDDRTTVASFLADWLTAASPALAPRTAISYAQVVRDHLEPQIGPLRLSRLTPQRVQRMMADLERAGVSPKSVVYARTVLRIALGVAMKWGLVGRNVAALVDPPKVQGRRIEPLSPAQAKALLDSLQDDPMQTFYLLAVTSGLRLGELLGLRWDALDLDAATLTVRQQVQRLGGELRATEILKRPSSGATIALAQPAVAALRAHRLASERIGGYVFATASGEPLDPSNVRRHWRKALDQAGLPPRRLHDLRHSTATFLLAAGVPARVVQEILRHANSRMMSTYQHPDLAMQREAMGRLGELLEGRP